MKTKVITLPNGFSDGAGGVIRELEIRKLNGNDEDMLLDKEAHEGGRVFDQLVKGCIVRAGTLTDQGKIGSIYDRFFLLADTTFVLIQLRIWGIGPTYRFEHECSKCGEIGQHSINLNELSIDEQKEEYRGQAEYTETYDGLPVTFRPLYIRDQATLETMRQRYPHDRASRELMLQITKLDGVAPTEAALKELDMGTRNAIRNSIDARSGGIDVEILSDCQKCEKTTKGTLPVEVRSFFFQAGVSSKTKTARPFRSSGTTRTSSANESAGAQTTFAGSA